MAPESLPVLAKAKLRLQPSTRATLRGATHSLALGCSGTGAVARCAVATAADCGSAAAFAAGCLPSSGNEVGGPAQVERDGRRASPHLWSVSTDVAGVSQTAQLPPNAPGWGDRVGDPSLQPGQPGTVAREAAVHVLPRGAKARPFPGQFGPHGPVRLVVGSCPIPQWIDERDLDRNSAPGPETIFDRSHLVEWNVDAPVGLPRVEQPLGGEVAANNRQGDMALPRIGKPAGPGEPVAQKGRRPEDRLGRAPVGHQERPVILPASGELTLSETYRNARKAIEDLRFVLGLLREVNRREDKSVGRRHRFRHRPDSRAPAGTLPGQ